MTKYEEITNHNKVNRMTHKDEGLIFSSSDYDKFIAEVVSKEAVGFRMLYFVDKEAVDGAYGDQDYIVVANRNKEDVSLVIYTQIIKDKVLSFSEKNICENGVINYMPKDPVDILVFKNEEFEV